MQTIKIHGAGFADKLLAYMIRYYSDRGYNITATRSYDQSLGATWTIEISKEAKGNDSNELN